MARFRHRSAKCVDADRATGHRPGMRLSALASALVALVAVSACSATPDEPPRADGPTTGPTAAEAGLSGLDCRKALLEPVVQGDAHIRPDPSAAHVCDARDATEMAVLTEDLDSLVKAINNR